jgi:hypothetical protein
MSYEDRKLEKWAVDLQASKITVKLPLIPGEGFLLKIK